MPAEDDNRQERMSIDLSVLITRKYPPGNLYMPPVARFERDQRYDPPSAPPPYSSVLDDVVHTGEDMIERANRQWAAGFPARIRAGQSPAGAGTLGTRISPLSMPEQIRGRMVAVSL